MAEVFGAERGVYGIAPLSLAWEFDENSAFPSVRLALGEVQLRLLYFSTQASYYFYSLCCGASLSYWEDEVGGLRCSLCEAASAFAHPQGLVLSEEFRSTLKAALSSSLEPLAAELLVSVALDFHEVLGASVGDRP